VRSAEEFVDDFMIDDWIEDLPSVETELAEQRARPLLEVRSPKLFLPKNRLRVGVKPPVAPERITFGVKGDPEIDSSGFIEDWEEQPGGPEVSDMATETESHEEMEDDFEGSEQENGDEIGTGRGEVLVLGTGKESDGDEEEKDEGSPDGGEPESFENEGHEVEASEDELDDQGDGEELVEDEGEQDVRQHGEKFPAAFDKAAADLVDRVHDGEDDDLGFHLEIMEDGL
jgi:hypothetical protein